MPQITECGAAALRNFRCDENVHVVVVASPIDAGRIASIYRNSLKPLA